MISEKLLSKARSVLDETIFQVRERFGRRIEPEQRRRRLLELAELEPRVLFSASPAVLLSTASDVGSPSGAPGLDSWTAGEILEVADPNFALDPGTTGGTFSSISNFDDFAADGDADIDAIHFVTRNITVGTGSQIDLFEGDLLLSTAADENFTSSNSLSVNDEDVFIFRPDVQGDYSAGTFVMLLDGIVGVDDLVGIALVEQDTTVGDAALQAGTFLFSHNGGGVQSNVYHHSADNVGAGTTSGTISLLIDGSDLGYTQKVAGLDLIEATTTVGGTLLQSGTILQTIGNGSATVGDNAISVQRQDIFALDVSTTTLVAGTSAANATLIFDGSDVGLSANAEDLDGLSIVVATDPTLPVLDLDADDSSGTGGADYVTGFVEKDPPVLIVDGDATLTDVDSPTLVSLIVTNTNVQTQGAESLSADTSGTSISASYDSNTAVLTLSGVDTVANYEQVLRTITYSNNSGKPNTISRTITFVANDGSGDSNVGVTTLTFTDVNDAPVNSVPGNQNMTENTTLAFSTAGGNQIFVSDIDAGTAPIEVTLTATNGVTTLNGTSGLAFTTGDGTADATMTFTGSIVDVNAALDGLSFDPTPTFTGAASLQITTDDLGNTGTGGAQTDQDAVSINVIALIPPVIDLDADDSAAIGGDYATTFVEDGGPVTVADSDAVLTDADSLNLQSLTVTITNLQDGAAETLSSVTFGTSIVSAYNSATGVLSLTGSDSVANYQQVLRTVTYENSSQAPATTDRQISFVAGDGVKSSAAALTTLTITAVNDAPVAVDDNFSVDGNQTLTVQAVTGVLVNDGDVENDPLTAVLIGGPSNGTLTLNPDGSLTYTPNVLFQGTDSFQYQVSDLVAASNVATVSITVNEILAPAPPNTTPDRDVNNDRGDDQADEDDSDQSEENLSLGPLPFLESGSPETGTRHGASSAASVDDFGSGSTTDDATVAVAVVTTHEPNLSLFGQFAGFHRTAIARPGGDDLRDDGSTPVDISSIFESGLLWEQLDSLQDDLDGDFNFDTLVAGTATVMTTALSVGYVFWTLKGGYLMASLLSTMPAWRLLDPLPILDNLADSVHDKRRGDEDDEETLQSMVEGNHA